jgi:hypothetical protein
MNKTTQKSQRPTESFFTADTKNKVNAAASMADQLPHTLYYHPSFESLAQKIAATGAVTLGKCSWKSFADKFPQLRIEDPRVLERSQSVSILINFADPAIMFEQLAMIYALPRMGAPNFRVILPYFSVGTMERVDSFGEVATAMTIARLLSNTPLCATGPSSVVIYDIHALQEQFYFGDSVHAQLCTAMTLLTERLAKLSDVTIVFPDDGAHSGIFQDFWITDSVPHSASAVEGKGPFQVLSLAPLISHLVQSRKAPARFN